MIYDLESLPNIFTASFSNGLLFEISFRRDETEELIHFLRGVQELVGFNNIEYDYPLLHFIIKHKHVITAELIYEKSTQLISTSFTQGWRNRIRESDHYIKQIDLRLIHQFNNVSRLTSLKDLQFAMKLSNLKEFSVGFDRSLSDAEMEQLIEYNHHDVQATVAFAKESEDKIAFRRKFQKDTGVSCMNLSDSKLGEKYFEQELIKVNPEWIYSNGKKRQTLRKPSFSIPDFTLNIESYNNDLPEEFHFPEKPIFDDVPALIMKKKGKSGIDFEYRLALKRQRKEIERIGKRNRREVDAWLKNCKKKHEENLTAVWIPVKDLIFDYIKFEHLELNKILTSYLDYNITQTKGGFSEICTIDGFNFHFGQGGIHGSISNSIVRSDEDFIIRDIDIKGAYPKIAIVNKLYPAHFGEGFCAIYEDVFQQRENYKEGTTLNRALKLAVNAVFGNSINEYSIFYDPAFGMQITINGQLLICMLAEQLMKLDGLTLIQINTDGLTIRYLRKFTSWVESVEKWWMGLTKLDLKTVNYKAMFIRDVNNYIGWFEDGKRKRKGVFAYEVKPSELEWNKNHSGLVIRKAVEAFLIKGTAVHDFIHNHNDIFDFMMRGKVNRTDRLTIVKNLEEIDQQRTIRFYFSTTGGELIKYMPPLRKEKDLAKQENREPNNRRSAYPGSKGMKVTACNHIDDFDDDVDYGYYIDAAEKILESVGVSKGSHGKSRVVG